MDRLCGGGLRPARPPPNPLLGLGVFHEGRPADSLGTRMHHLKYIDASEEMRIGLMTDRRLHPLNEDGSVPYANLYAAGAVLGGFEYAGPGGFCVPILSGLLFRRHT